MTLLPDPTAVGTAPTRLTTLPTAVCAALAPLAALRRAVERPAQSAAPRSPPWWEAR